MIVWLSCEPIFQTSAIPWAPNPIIAIGMCFPDKCTYWDTAQLAHMRTYILPFYVLFYSLRIYHTVSWNSKYPLTALLFM